MEGTCIWFGPTYGYLGVGIFTNGSYEGQIYVHYKNIVRKGLRNQKYRELKPGDVCEFTEGEGFYNNGTQAMKVRVKYLATDNDERCEVQDGDKEPEQLGERGVEGLNLEVSKDLDGAVQEKHEGWKGTKRDDATRQGSDDANPDKVGRPRQKDKGKGKPKQK